MHKRLIVLSALALLAVSCNPLGGSTSSSDLGVMKSTTGGTDWARSNLAKVVVDPEAKKPKKEAAPAESGLGSSSVTILRAHPQNAQRLFAGVLNNGLYFSENGAESWTNILSKFSVTDVALHPTESDHIFVSGQATGRARVLETRDLGKSWQEIYNDAVPDNSARAVVLDPRNPNNIIVGLRSGNVIGSTDSGQSWTLLQNMADTIEQIVWQESGTLYIVAKSKGVFLSRDSGVTINLITTDLSDVGSWQKRLSQIIPTSGVKPVDVPASSASVFYGVGVSRSPSEVYVGANNGLFVSQNGGTDWTYLKLPLQNYDQAGVKAVAKGANQLYAAVGNTVFKSNNNGQSWTVAAIATSGVIDYILVDPTADLVLYAGLTSIR